MKYVFTGVVRPERASISTPKVTNILDSGEVFSLLCHGSQFKVTVESEKLDGYFAAKILAQNFASTVIVSLGFARGISLSVEILQYTAEDDEFFFGADPIRPSVSDSLGYENELAEFGRALDLACADVFFRFALRDYSQALINETDCATYCYRAIESIRCAFDFETGREKNWRAMHDALGTDREEIRLKVKEYSDPVRHGNWLGAKETNTEIRWKMFELTRDVLGRYLTYRGR
ncbi:hypothetical protein [Pseudomonas sp. MOIL14HWK12:I2]|uniref:hypothetical protein n=1 Tax=Pseudomonas sp. MOIL14HWK12:I2 TaxID=1033994 RepID=UPI0012EBD92B|nr:hypothetical protein [Pseudomonas sp. MOIL14HWK12:I2]